ncbi:MAG: peptidoglycan-binding protein [Gemmatimonadota bacterium]
MNAMIRMPRSLRAQLAAALLAVAGAAGGAAAGHAQQRLLLPEGTVVTVTTRTALSSASAREGATFETTVSDSVRVEGFTVIPAGSAIEGIVTTVRPATERQSGVIGVEFTRITLPNGSSTTIDGKLTSTDPGERRQIDAQPGAQVLLVGGRRGAGAAIGAVGAGQGNDPFANVLGALGTMLSKGDDVTVPAGTKLAVQLERGIAMRVVGTDRATRSDAFTIYTSADAIRAAQNALRQKGYYRGAADGTLGEATQRALVEFQIDNGIIVTGNLDGRTAQALGLELGEGSRLTPAEAALVRRNAQVLVTRQSSTLGMSQAGGLDPRRSYQPEELELYFALSAFADNASLYEEIARLSGNVDGLEAAGRALVEAARRVDEAMRSTRVASRTAAAWGDVQADLTTLDPGYRSGR